MIQINNLSVFYNDKNKKIKGVGPINFTGRDKEIYAIIGPSGCGKSTLLSVLAGIVKEYEGEILLNGENLSPHKHKIGFIPQTFGLLPWKTVEQNSIIPFKIRGEKISKEVIKKMDIMMNRLNISQLKNRFPNEISGGQKQRVAIVRSFLIKPDLLLMDEAFSALDEIIREEAQELFLEFWNENRMTTFFVTHSIDEALYMGRKIVIMSNNPGEITEIIDNSLFGNKMYKENDKYWEIFFHIKNLIRKGWDM